VKRSDELRDLSVEHHHGLVLARRARRAAAGEDGATPGEVWDGIAERFRAELEPHFAIEEDVLAPALEATGEAELVRRLREEHAELRSFVAPDGPRTWVALRRFGELLGDHIRFEERVLFDRAEAVLDADALAAVARACAERGS
jgi:hemerythrin-like domain-containing protein